MYRFAWVVLLCACASQSKIPEQASSPKETGRKAAGAMALDVEAKLQAATKSTPLESAEIDNRDIWNSDADVFVKRCKRKGNQEVCMTAGDSNLEKAAHSLPVRDEVDAGDEMYQAEAKCRHSEFAKCLDWIVLGENGEWYSPVKIMCHDKAFTCQVKSEPARVEEFVQVCHLEDSSIECEKSQEGTYTHTVLRYKK